MHSRVQQLKLPIVRRSGRSPKIHPNLSKEKKLVTKKMKMMKVMMKVMKAKESPMARRPQRVSEVGKQLPGKVQGVAEAVFQLQARLQILLRQSPAREEDHASHSNPWSVLGRSSVTLPSRAEEDEGLCTID